MTGNWARCGPLKPLVEFVLKALARNPVDFFNVDRFSFIKGDEVSHAIPCKKCGNLNTTIGVKITSTPVH